MLFMFFLLLLRLLCCYLRILEKYVLGWADRNIIPASFAVVFHFFFPSHLGGLRLPFAAVGFFCISFASYFATNVSIIYVLFPVHSG